MPNRTGPRPGAKFNLEQRLLLLQDWAASGLRAGAFAAQRPGLTQAMLYNWQHRHGKPAGPPQSNEYVVILPVTVGQAVHRELSRGAAEMSVLAGRIVGPEEYAESVLRNFLTPTPKRW